MGSRLLDSTEWTMPADLGRVSPLVIEVAGFLEEHGVGGEPLFTAQLVLEEVVGNVVRHAYHGDPSGELRVRVTIEPDEVIVVVEDCGAPFDPVNEAPAPDLHGSLEERRVGGLGLHLVKSLTRSVDYERIDRTNRVSMSVGLSKAS